MQIDSLNSYFFKTTILPLIFCLSSLQAQQTQTLFNNRQRVNPVTENNKQLEIEKQRKQAWEEAQKKLIPEAISVIEETKQALALAKKGDQRKALDTVNQAIGKIDGLLTRHPKSALLPIDFIINVINTAPTDKELIQDIGNAAESAVEDKRYPDARLLLDTLRSEINITFYTLPLAIYPIALKEARNLLEQNRTAEATRVLQETKNTLVVLSQVMPIPVINTIVLLSLAEEEEKRNASKDKEAELRLINLAKNELERARELGYAGNDREYSALKELIKSLEEKVNANQTGTTLFGSLKDRLKGFFKRISEDKKQAQPSENNQQSQTNY